MRFQQNFDLKQTRTKETQAILASEDKVGAYKDFGYPVGELNRWLKKMKEFGFVIEWSCV